MNEKINGLIKLQELDSRLDALQQAKAKLAPQRDRINADIQALQAQFEDTKKSLTQAQVDKKSLELEIEAKEQVVRKSTGELNNVKSNDAYKALLTQIEESKKAKFELEDTVLEIMERIEKLQKDSKEREKQFVDSKAALEKKTAELGADERRLQEEFDKQKAERDAFAQSLPEDTRARYEQIQRGRPGFTVVVPVTGGMICGGCRQTLPPTVVNEAMKGKELVACDSCSRILFIPPSQPAVSQPQ